MVSNIFPPVDYAMHSSESKRIPFLAQTTSPLFAIILSMIACTIGWVSKYDQFTL